MVIITGLDGSDHSAIISAIWELRKEAKRLELDGELREVEGGFPGRVEIELRMIEREADSLVAKMGEAITEVDKNYASVKFGEAIGKIAGLRRALKIFKQEQNKGRAVNQKGQG